MAFPQLSFTVGGIGTIIELGQEAVAFVEGMGGNGSYSMVTV